MFVCNFSIGHVFPKSSELHVTFIARSHCRQLTGTSARLISWRTITRPFGHRYICTLSASTLVWLECSVRIRVSSGVRATVPKVPLKNPWFHCQKCMIIDFVLLISRFNQMKLKVCIWVPLFRNGLHSYNTSCTHKTYQ